MKNRTVEEVKTLAQRLIDNFETEFNYLKTSWSTFLPSIFVNQDITQWKNIAARNIASELVLIKEIEDPEVQIQALFQLVHNFFQESRVIREQHPYVDGGSQYPFKSSNFEDTLYRAFDSTYMLLTEEEAKELGVYDTALCSYVFYTERDCQFALKDNTDGIFNNFPFCLDETHDAVYKQYIGEQQAHVPQDSCQ
jgi:hypothetical protein